MISCIFASAVDTTVPPVSVARKKLSSSHSRAVVVWRMNTTCTASYSLVRNR